MSKYWSKLLFEAIQKIYAAHKCNQKTPSEVQSHIKPSKYALNSTAKANTWYSKYTGKSETTFDLSLKNHWKDVNRHNSLQDNQHFRLPGHKFNKHLQFIIIEQLNETNID